jgi:hypothetical protein
MALSPNNPRNQGAWHPSEVPASGASTSRFCLGTSPNGDTADPPAVVALAFATLTEDRLAAASELPPEAREVELRYVGRKDSGDWAMFKRGRVRGTVTRDPIRPGKFSKLNLEAGALLDSFFLGEEAFLSAPDFAVWDALLEMCVTLNPPPRTARSLNDSVSRLIALRAGLEIHPGSLPNPGAQIEGD